MSINRMRLADTFLYEEGEKWFKIKVIYFSVDEKSGKEKKVVNHMLLNADGIHQALERITDSMRNFLIPYEVTDVCLTQILDVYPYQETEADKITENMRPLSEVLAEREAQNKAPFS